MLNLRAPISTVSELTQEDDSLNALTSFELELIAGGGATENNF